MLELLILLPIIIQCILKLTIGVSLDEMANISRGNYLRYDQIDSRHHHRREDEVFYLVVASGETAEDTRLKCTCGGYTQDDSRNLDMEWFRFHKSMADAYGFTGSKYSRLASLSDAYGDRHCRCVIVAAQRRWKPPV